jgi:transketolase
LSIDAIQKAKSGHPGTPMDAAPTVYCLWQRFLRFDPQDPNWPNRDRFVLSNGHASAMLYSLLHLTEVKAANASYGQMGGPAVSLEDIKGFRQARSRCPGHPEYGWTSGVETTTGPLGQGLATSVGMAMAERWLAATYNRPGYELFDHDVYALCGDGCMMEGISSEAASLAGHQRLSNLCWIYDNNHVTIEGQTKITFTEDVASRFLAYHWNVTRVSDANDLEMLARAFSTFKATADGPTLIIIESHIGYGAPHKQDTASAHGEPLGAEEVRLTKEFYGWDPDSQFYVPDGVREHFREHFGTRGEQLRLSWEQTFSEYRRQYPDLADEIDRMLHREMPRQWDQHLINVPPDSKGIATRDTSGQVLNILAENVPWLLGGSADLSPSTRTHLQFESAGEFQAPNDLGTYRGRNMHFGIREHAMCAIANGLALSHLRPFVSGFFVFTDYCRGAMRLSALMELPVIYIWTHDSISIGEDGPTHEPIEQLASFRAMPGMIVLRPADANEVVEAYRVAMQLKDRPVCLILSRQKLPVLDRSRFAEASGVARGAYALTDAPHGKPDVLLLASGSEVSLCVEAYGQLGAQGINARVVSMPSWELFESQSKEYRDSVIPPSVTARVAVEEASTFGWAHYTGPNGVILGMHTFGLSAPMRIVQDHFGFLPEHVVAAAKDQLAIGKR